ncbi:unnamed protein product [Blepharisma stoltei]|uniref:EF-hand domain-containing protein n=1 Tax=Blepharisma stoltei TaxID=1481888 RepID=A0AAU9IN62_9CILI|nr:unnamed protein product [Blepharisma stoltei]
MAGIKLELSQAELNRFASLMQDFYMHSDNSKLPDLFRLFDRNHNGLIERLELETVMQQVSGDNSSTQEIREMIEEADVNHNGVIELDEFMEIMKKHRDA